MEKILLKSTQLFNPSKKLEGISILVVDDESLLRELLRALFELEGASVYEAESGNTALEFLKKNSVDGVLSDLRMPDGDGFSLLKGMKLLEKELPLIFFYTGYFNISEAEAQALGVIQVFSKPFELDFMIDTIQGAITASRVN